MINRVRKQRGFTVVDNGYLYDPSLTLEAVGLLTVIFSYPDGKLITIESIAERRKLDSAYKVRGAMKQLIENGYCTRTKRQDGKGIFRGWDYTVFEEKQLLPDLPISQVGESTDLRNTDVGKTSVNINTISSNTINSSKIIDSSIDIDYSLNTVETENLKQDQQISENENSGDFTDSNGNGEPSTPTNPKERKSCAKKKEKADVSLIPIPDVLNTPEFCQAWSKLCSLTKWRRKPDSAILLALKKLSEFDVRFATELCESAHAGDYQGVVFPDTKYKYEQWKKRYNHGSGQNQGFRERASADVARIDAEFSGANG